MTIRALVFRRLAISALALVVAGIGLPLHAQTQGSEPIDHSHHHAEATVVDAGAGPFATDAPLRAGMSRVSDSVEALAAMTASAADGVDEAHVLALTAEMHAAIQSIFAECKLPPDADAALHPLLADLLQATTALKEAPSNLQPVASMQDVLTRYADQFRDEDRKNSHSH